MPPKKKAKPRKPAAKAKAAPRKAPKAKAKAVAKATAPVAAPAKPREQVTIAKAKGRPMLSWVGKRPLRAVTAFPAQLVEFYAPKGADKVPVADASIWKDWPAQYPKGGLLFHGDNKEVLAHLLANGFRGKVQLVYIDPPFDSGADYVRKVSLRGPDGKTKVEGEAYTLGEQIQYTDIWANDNYLQFMYERLMMLKELLTTDGSIWLHCDYRRVHHLRCLMDEVFGAESILNEVIWTFYGPGSPGMRQFNRKHNNLLWYRNGEEWTFEDMAIRMPHDEKTQGNFAQGLEGSGFAADTYELEKGGKIPETHWEYAIAQRFPVDGVKRVDYPTEKPWALVERVIKAASKPGGIVLDAFLGSGVVSAVAQSLGRRWIGCDINKGSIQTTTRRLQKIIAEQVTDQVKKMRAPELIKDENEPPEPAQYGFTAHRVNDYDLAIQHNEAVNLACEHIGVTRTLADSFFDGTFGEKLVKIIPFGHPLSPADLEEVKTELDTRAKETRDVVVVCLGKEMAVDPWLGEWNRMRKQGDTPNKIEVIELRSDPKYGKFIAHKPAAARVEIRREKAKGGDKILVEITDFISPSIAERLQDAGGVLAPKIPEWRAMVDSVMIDPAHDGKVFNIAIADVPARKQDYVQGKYELPAPAAKTTVAVKVTDMLGEEVVITKEV